MGLYTTFDNLKPIVKNFCNTRDWGRKQKLNHFSFAIVFSFQLTFGLFTPASAKVRHNQKISKFSGVVTGCHDGDTCKVSFKGSSIKIRLAGIDAPELNQQEGISARNFLESKILKKTVALDCKGKSYDRLVCTVLLQDVDISEEMVRNGFAFDYAKYSNGKYNALMVTAKAKKIGIWKTLQKSPFCTRHFQNEACRSNSFYNH